MWVEVLLTLLLAIIMGIARTWPAGAQPPKMLCLFKLLSVSGQKAEDKDSDALAKLSMQIAKLMKDNEKMNDKVATLQQLQHTNSKDMEFEIVDDDDDDDDDDDITAPSRMHATTPYLNQDDAIALNPDDVVAPTPLQPLDIDDKTTDTTQGIEIKVHKSAMEKDDDEFAPNPVLATPENLLPTAPNDDIAPIHVPAVPQAAMLPREDVIAPSQLHATLHSTMLPTTPYSAVVEKGLQDAEVISKLVTSLKAQNLDYVKVEVDKLAKKDLEDAADELIKVTKGGIDVIPPPKLAKAHAHIQVAVAQLKSEEKDSSAYNIILAKLVRTACTDIVQSLSKDEDEHYDDFEESEPLALSESDDEAEVGPRFSCARLSMKELAAIHAFDVNSNMPPNKTVRNAMNKFGKGASASPNSAVIGAMPPGCCASVLASASCNH